MAYTWCKDTYNTDELSIMHRDKVLPPGLPGSSKPYWTQIVWLLNFYSTMITLWKKWKLAFTMSCTNVHIHQQLSKDA